MVRTSIWYLRMIRVSSFQTNPDFRRSDCEHSLYSDLKDTQLFLTQSWNFDCHGGSCLLPCCEPCQKRRKNLSTIRSRGIGPFFHRFSDRSCTPNRVICRPTFDAAASRQKRQRSGLWLVRALKSNSINKFFACNFELLKRTHNPKNPKFNEITKNITYCLKENTVERQNPNVRFGEHNQIWFGLKSFGLVCSVR